MDYESVKTMINSSHKNPDEYQRTSRHHTVQERYLEIHAAIEDVDLHPTLQPQN